MIDLLIWYYHYAQQSLEATKKQQIFFASQKELILVIEINLYVNIILR